MTPIMKKIRDASVATLGTIILATSAFGDAREDDTPVSQPKKATVGTAVVPDQSKETYDLMAQEIAAQNEAARKEAADAARRRAEVDADQQFVQVPAEQHFAASGDVYDDKQKYRAFETIPVVSGRTKRHLVSRDGSDVVLGAREVGQGITEVRKTAIGLTAVSENDFERGFVSSTVIADKSEVDAIVDVARGFIGAARDAVGIVRDGANIKNDKKHADAAMITAERSGGPEVINNNTVSSSSHAGGATVALENVGNSSSEAEVKGSGNSSAEAEVKGSGNSDNVNVNKDKTKIEIGGKTHHRPDPCGYGKCGGGQHGYHK